MKTVYKYKLNMDGSVELPPNAEILHVNHQDGEPYIWALVDKDAKPGVERHIRVYGTGHDIPDNPGRYINTFFAGCFVWHVFEDFFRITEETHER